MIIMTTMIMNIIIIMITVTISISTFFFFIPWLWFILGPLGYLGFGGQPGLGTPSTERRAIKG